MFLVLLKNGATIDDNLLKEICLNGDCTTVNILLDLELSRRTLLKGFKTLNEKNLSYFYLFLKRTQNVNTVNLDLLDNEFKISIRDSIDLYDELKLLFNQVNTQLLTHYIECLIIFFKYNYFDFYSHRVIANILNIVNEFYCKIDDKEIKNRIQYLYGLAVYSSSLDLFKENKEWVTKLAANNEFENICSLTKSPLSLQALSRIQIRKSFKPLNSLFEFKNKKQNIPNVLIKYLEYEFL